jgi:DNA (cytosine-5)-methyltransferase 1
MRYLSVCSGIEAASVAWDPLGWEPAGFSEIEPFPCAVLAHRFPNVKNYGDMTKYKEWKIGNGTVDLLVGVTPCQSFSVAGLRRGLEDPRGNLMLTFGAIANHLRPAWIVWENVPGVLSSDGGRDFGTFLGMLGQLGYGFAYRVLDAQYFGVAQRRRRVFLVGYLGDWRPAAAVLFESESLCGYPPPSREKGKGVTGTISARTSGGGGLGTDFELGGGLQVAHTLRGEGFDASEDGTGRGTPIVPVGAFALRGREGGAMPENEGDKAGALRASAGGSSRSYVYDMRGRGDGNTVPTLCTDHPSRPSDFCPVVMATGQGNAEIAEGRAPTLNCNHEAPIVAIQGTMIGRSENAGPNGPGYDETGVMFTLTKTDQHGVCAPAYGIPGNWIGREPQNGGNAVEPMHDISPCLTKTDQHGVSAGSTVRRLTPRECERLQGFPDDWTKIPYRGRAAEECPDGPRYKACGNSMATTAMHWIGARIDKVNREWGK